jgi:hypothetical protein
MKDLTEILAISGKGGLFRMITQAKNSIIVESLLEKKRFPVHSTEAVSSLEEISIFTETEDLPLKDVFKRIYDKTGGEKTISHKASAKELKEFMEEIVPEYDEERVYVSDIKKVVKWYNHLKDAEMLDEFFAGDEEETREEDEDSSGESTDESGGEQDSKHDE